MSTFWATMPFSPLRHVFASQSGLIVYGGGGGGGGASMDEIRAFVKPELDAAVADRLNKYTGITNTVQSGFNNANTQFGNLGSRIDRSMEDSQRQLGQLNSGLMSTIGQGQQTILQGQSNLQQGIGNQMNMGFDRVGNQLTTGFDRVGDNVQSGFADAGRRFTGLENSASNLQTNMDRGFQETGNALSDVSTEISDNNIDTNRNIDTNFAAQNQALGQSFSTASQQMSDLQSNVLGGQDDLGDRINTVGSNLNTYYGDLSANQAAMAGANADFRTSFDDYVNRYSDDTALANQDRADMARAIQTEAADSRDLMSRFASAGQDERFDLRQAIAGNSRGIQNTQQDIANNTGLMSQQLGDVGNQVQDQGTNTLNALNNVRTILSGDISGLSGDQVQQFRQVSNAFNREGQLIQNQITQNGTVLTNELDEVGNLTTNEFAANGNLLGSSAVNLNNFAN